MRKRRTVGRPNKIRNVNATQFIQNLRLNQDKTKLNEHRKLSIVKNAFKIYHKIEGPKGYYVTNELFKLCLDFKHSNEVFSIWNDILKHRNNISYVLLFKCCIQTGDIHKSIQVLQLFHSLNATQLHTREYSIFVSKTLTNSQTLQQIRTIHSLFDRNTLQKDIFIKTALINGYNKFGAMDSALKVFNSIQDCDKDCVCINAIMKAFLNSDCPNKALLIFDKYSHSHSLRVSDSIIALKCCIHTNDFEKGQKIHNLSVSSDNAMFVTTLIDFYGHFGDISTAQKIFDSVNECQKDQIMLTSMLRCLPPNSALQLYDKYSVMFADITLNSFALKACISTDNFENGMRIIHSVTKLNIYNAILIEFYAHFGYINNAMHIFIDSIDSICIGAIMKALIDNNRNRNALFIYQIWTQFIDVKSHVLALKACINSNDFEKGQQIIATSLWTEYERSNTKVITIFIDFYGHFGEVTKANNIFEKSRHSHTNIACVNAMMNVFCKNDLNKECIDLFNFVFVKNDKKCVFKANNVSFTIVLKACTHSALLHCGISIHKSLESINEHLLSDLGIQICLLGMYGKCGQMQQCKSLFEQFIQNNNHKKNEIRLWNALLYCYGRNGQIKEAMKMYYEMEICPNHKTFVILLNACGHCGEIAMALHLWNEEISDESIKVKIVSVYIDCMAKHGYLNEAYDLALKYDKSTMTNKENDNKTMWISLLNGCTKFEDHKLAKQVYCEIEKRYALKENCTENQRTDRKSE